jgi:hypothetical protein
MAIGDAAFSQGDIMRRIKALEDKQREQGAGRRLENATIGDGGLRIKGDGGITLQNGGGVTVEDGGGVLIEAGGALEVMHETGARLLRIWRHPDDGRYRLELRRDNGKHVLYTQVHAASGRQFWALCDGEGNILVSDSAEFGVGLARPWIPVVLYPRFLPSAPAAGVDGSWAISTSAITSEKTLWEGRATIDHPLLTVDGHWGHASGSGPITYNLYVAGEQVGTWTEDAQTIAQRGPFDVSKWVLSDWRVVTITAIAAGGATGLALCQPYAVYLM